MIGWQYVLLQFDVVLRYLTLLVVPRGQTVFHAVPAATIDNPRTWLAVAVVVGLVGLAIRMRHRAASASFGLFWFLLLLIPSAALVVFDRGEPMAEHRIYVASMGLFLGAGAAMGGISSRLVETAPRLRLLGTVAFIVVLTGFAGRTVIRNAVWASPVGLWGEAVQLAPDHWFPQLLFGEALHNAGRRDEAIRAYSRAIALRPEEAAAYQKLALGYAEQGRFAEARETFERLRRIDPKSPIPPNGLGAIALLTNEPGRSPRVLSRGPGVGSGQRAGAAGAGGDGRTGAGRLWRSVAALSGNPAAGAADARQRRLHPPEPGQSRGDDPLTHGLGFRRERPITV